MEKTHTNKKQTDMKKTFLTKPLLALCCAVGLASTGFAAPASAFAPSRSCIAADSAVVPVNPGALIGVWETEIEGQAQTMEFKMDGTVSVEIKFREAQSGISLHVKVTDAEWRLADDTLTIDPRKAKADIEFGLPPGMESFASMLEQQKAAMLQQFKAQAGQKLVVSMPDNDTLKATDVANSGVTVDFKRKSADKSGDSASKDKKKKDKKNKG